MKAKKPVSISISDKPNRPGDFDAFSAAPSEGFLSQYMHYAKETSDAPAIFHLGAGLATLSASVSGKVSLQSKVGKTEISTPLHVWVMLLGDSTTRKSTACDRALRLYQGETGPASGTVEKILSWVGLNPHSLFYFPELSGLIHQNSFAPFLSEIYDGNDFRRTLMSGGSKLEIVVLQPRATILTCASLGMLQMVMSKASWLGGIFGRMLPFHGEQTQFCPFPNLRNPSAESAVRDVLGKVVEAASDSTGIGLTEKAIDAYVEWGREINELISSKPDHVRAALTRLPQHILRVAGLYAVSCMHSAVGESEMTRAISLGRYTVGAIETLGMALSPDPVVRTMFVLRNVLENVPENTLSLRDVQRATGMAWKTLEAAATSMCDTGELEILVRSEHNKPRQKWIKLTPNTTSALENTSSS